MAKKIHTLILPNLNAWDLDKYNAMVFPELFKPVKPAKEPKAQAVKPLPTPKPVAEVPRPTGGAIRAGGTSAWGAKQWQAKQWTPAHLTSAGWDLVSIAHKRVQASAQAKRRR
jgi:hypothetical protein